MGQSCRGVAQPEFSPPWIVGRQLPHRALASSHVQEQGTLSVPFHSASTQTVSPQSGERATPLPWPLGPTVPLSRVSTCLPGVPPPQPSSGAAGSGRHCSRLPYSRHLAPLLCMGMPQPPPSTPSFCFPQQLLQARGSVSCLGSLLASFSACWGPSVPDLLLHAALLGHTWPLPRSFPLPGSLFLR